MAVWFVKVSGSEGRVTAVLKDQWNEALSDVREFRASGRQAWIKDIDGRVIDEETAMPK